MILTFQLQQPASLVYDHLADAQKFSAIHPVIYKVQQLNEEEYKFYECLRIFNIPFRFTYLVNIRPQPEKQRIEMSSEVKRGVHLRLDFSLSSVNDKTVVEEKVHIKAPPIIHQIFSAILVKAHRQLFHNLNALA